MDNKSTTKRMIGAVVLVLIAALLLAWLLKGKNQSVQEQQDLIADQTQEASPILGFPGVNEGEEAGDGQVAQNTDGEASQNGEAAQDGSGSYVIGATDQANQAADTAQQQAKNALAASGAAASGAATQATEAVKQGGQEVANATGFKVRDSQEQEGAEQRPIVEGGEVKTGTGSMGSTEVATNAQDQQQAGGATDGGDGNTQAAAGSGAATQQAASTTTDNSGDSAGSNTQQAQQSTGDSNAGASQSTKAAVANPKLVNEKPVPAPKTQTAVSKSNKSSGGSSGNKKSSTASQRASSSGSGGSVGGKGYAIQVLAASSRSKAENVRKDIARDGYPAFVVRANVNGKTVYRVRVGTYPAKGAASAVQRTMKARYTKNKFVQNSFVTRN